MNVAGRLDDVSEFENVIVKTGNSGDITRVRDVGRVELGAQTYSQQFQLNNRPATGICVFQSPGANALEVEKAVEKVTAPVAKAAAQVAPPKPAPKVAAPAKTPVAKKKAVVKAAPKAVAKTVKPLVATVVATADELAAAQGRLGDALEELRDPQLLVRAQRLRAATEIVSVNPAAAPALLVDAIRETRDTDPDLAWDMAFEALGAALLAGRYTQDKTPHEVAAAVTDLPPRRGERRTADLLPVVLLAALVAVQVFVGKGPDGPVLTVDARLAGLAAAFVALLLRAPFIVVVFVAALTAADERIRIRTTERVDSLNVTVAASIAMHHCFA